MPDFWKHEAWGLSNNLPWSTINTSATVTGYQNLLQSQSIPEARLPWTLAYRSLSDSSIYTNLNVTSINNLTDFVHKGKRIFPFPLCIRGFVPDSRIIPQPGLWAYGSEQAFPGLCSTFKDSHYPWEKKAKILRSPSSVTW